MSLKDPPASLRFPHPLAERVMQGSEEGLEVAEPPDLLRSVPASVHLTLVLSGPFASSEGGEKSSASRSRTGRSSRWASSSTLSLGMIKIAHLEPPGSGLPLVLLVRDPPAELSGR